jgi:thiamine-phosphate diphosphorylase
MKTLNNKLICLITEGKLTNENFQRDKNKLLELLKVAIDHQIDLIQIREKRIDASQLFEIARDAVSIAKNTKTRILINERFDIAIAANAHGVHLTSASLPIAAVRSLVADNFVVGVSTHAEDEIAIAVSSGTDYVTYGPIFPTGNKLLSKGIEDLKTICNKFRPFPILGLGGISIENYASVSEIASGFASIGFLTDPKNLSALRKG